MPHAVTTSVARKPSRRATAMMANTEESSRKARWTFSKNRYDNSECFVDRRRDRYEPVTDRAEIRQYVDHPAVDEVEQQDREGVAIDLQNSAGQSKPGSQIWLSGIDVDRQQGRRRQDEACAEQYSVEILRMSCVHEDPPRDRVQQVSKVGSSGFGVRKGEPLKKMILSLASLVPPSP